MRQQNIPTIFDDFDTLFSFFNTPTKMSCCAPTSFGVAISEDEEKVYIDAPIPGVNPEEVELSLDTEKKELTIQGTAKNERKEATVHSKKAECFCYKIPLGNAVRMDGEVEALAANGVLTVTLHKSGGAKPLKIPIKSG
jgi:HSP20 family protein